LRSYERPAKLTELAFIAIGSNIDPEVNLPRAVEQLRQLGQLQRVSQVYQTPPIGSRDQPDLLNAAVLIEVERSAEALRSDLRRIEDDLGRIRTTDKYAPRTIDLDLVLFGSQIVSGPGHTVPDPEITRRAHLAVTLADLAPDFTHPDSGEPLRVIAERLRSGSNLRARPDVTVKLRALQETPGGSN